MNITTERIDDFPLLLEVMQRLGLPAILDQSPGSSRIAPGLELGLDGDDLAGAYLEPEQSSQAAGAGLGETGA